MDKILQLPILEILKMASATQEETKQPNLSKPLFKEAGGVHGWLLKKAKTFMWDAASNTLTLPKGVTLTKEEREALEEVIGEIKEEAVEIEKRRQQHLSSMQEKGIKLKKNIVKGYSLLVSGSYRELTGILAGKIHDNLQNMLQINNWFLNGVWKTISGMFNSPQSKNKPKITVPRGRDGR